MIAARYRPLPGNRAALDFDRRQGHGSRRHLQHIAGRAAPRPQAGTAQQRRKAFFHCVATMQPRTLATGHLLGDERQRHIGLLRITAQRVRQRPGRDVVLPLDLLRLRDRPGRCAKPGQHQARGQCQAGDDARRGKGESAARACRVGMEHDRGPRIGRPGRSIRTGSSPFKGHDAPESRTRTAFAKNPVQRDTSPPARLTQTR